MSDDAILREKQRRLRKLKEQQARSGIDTPPQITIEIEDLEAEIAKLDGSASRAGLPHPPQPDFAHPYPIQSGFTGRVAERTLLTGWLSSSAQPVLAVIGIGGMGKSALTWAWLQRDVLGLPLPGASPDSPADTAACRLPEAARPEGVLWWSFYETQASFAAFLDEAISYVGDHSINPRDIPSTYDKARTLLSLLQQRRLLLVLDGLERELHAYSGLGAAYQGDAVDKQPRGEHRACTDPHAGRFLRDAATLPLKSRILITSRLFPRELDDLAGCRRENLATIDPEDAVTFFHAQGIRGTRAEIQAACKPYGYHGLALRLLAGVVTNHKRTPGDIRVANHYPVLAELKGREQHHILEVAYNQLDRPKRRLFSRLAAFRSPMPYDALAALNNYTDGDRFDRALNELEDRGLLCFDRVQAHYDMHPVVRGYAYDRLDDKPAVHIRLYEYFVDFPELGRDKVQSLDDLLPTIELYHHTVRAGRYDEACYLFHDRLQELLYYRFGAYQTCIELLRALFRDGVEEPSQVMSDNARAWSLSLLANSYARSGQPHSAKDRVLLAIELARRSGNKKNIAAGLGNLAGYRFILGELSWTGSALREGVELCHEIQDEFGEAARHQNLGQLLSYQGLFEEAIQEIGTSIIYCEKESYLQGQCQNTITLARCALLMGRKHVAFEAARKGRDLADIACFEADIICAEWLLGAALLAVSASAEGSHTTLAEAETHLTEALTRCRRINLIELEPDILLAWARWHYLQSNAAQARADADEALTIAERCEYRLAQADIHNFLARLALDSGDRAAARGHAAIATERAWCDGPPHCYKPALDEAERLLGEIG